MEHLMVLVVVADVDPGAQGDLPVIRRHKAVDHFQDRGLSSAVVADDGHPLAALYVKIHMGKQVLGTEGLLQVPDR